MVYIIEFNPKVRTLLCNSGDVMTSLPCCSAVRLNMIFLPATSTGESKTKGFNGWQPFKPYSLVVDLHCSAVRFYIAGPKQTNWTNKNVWYMYRECAFPKHWFQSSKPAQLWPNFGAWAGSCPSLVQNCTLNKLLRVSVCKIWLSQGNKGIGCGLAIPWSRILKINKEFSKYNCWTGKRVLSFDVCTQQIARTSLNHGCNLYQIP